MFNRLIIPICFMILAGIGLLGNNPTNTARIDSYHEQVRQIIESIPPEVDGWVGQQVPLPQSATSLLRPNAIISRHYVHLDRGLQATLLIVQCRDARDMAGHYPPVCYPGNGWLQREEPTDLVIPAFDQEIRRYVFHRVAGRDERDIYVYDLFALPTGETTLSMTDVRRLSSDYANRQLGAAQIQIVIDGQTDLKEHEWILDQMYAIVASAVEAVREGRTVTDPSEGGER